jgi:hypothetical protein
MAPRRLRADRLRTVMAEEIEVEAALMTLSEEAALSER